MNTRVITKGYRLENWIQIIRDHKSSGMTVSDYCEMTGITRSSYYYWLAQVREAAHDQITAAREMHNLGSVSSGFQEINVVNAYGDGGGRRADIPGQVTVEIRGITLKVDSAYPVMQLADLLRQLELS